MTNRLDTLWIRSIICFSLLSLCPAVSIVVQFVTSCKVWKGSAEWLLSYAGKIECLSWPAPCYHYAALLQFCCDLSQNLIWSRHVCKRQWGTFWVIMLTEINVSVWYHYMALLQFWGDRSQNLITSSMPPLWCTWKVRKISLQYFVHKTKCLLELLYLFCHTVLLPQFWANSVKR